MNSFDKGVYTDQIFLNTWNTTVEFDAVIGSLVDSGWTIQTQNAKDYAELYRDNKKLEINFTHVPENLEYDYIITDAVNKNFLTLGPCVFGNYFNDFSYTNHIPTKKFNCLIHRGCPVRQSWFYFFIKNKYLEDAHITYWCFDGLNNYTYNQNFTTLFYAGNTIFADEHAYAKKCLTIPYKNFTLEIEQAIIDSEKTLVIETFFNATDIQNFSEKTFRALQLPRPFLLFGHKNSVKLLKNWGFEVYDDFIDHSYDSLDDWHERQRNILGQLVTPIDYNSSLLNDFEQRAQHNRNLLKNYKKQWPDFFNKFLKQLKKL